MAKSNLSEEQRMAWVGRQFGRLLVTESGGGEKVSTVCSCGIHKKITKSALASGGTTSCGCYNKEVVSKLFTTHGEAGTSTYKIWGGMVNRCHNPKNASFKWYGALGISVCKAWRDSYVRFFSDMGVRPVKAQIDRIDVRGDYELSNCRWVSNRENANNKRNSIRVGGRTVGELAEEYGVSRYTIYTWINKYNYSSSAVIAKLGLIANRKTNPCEAETKVEEK